MSNDHEYWAESIAIAAEECDPPVLMTPEQLAYMADAMSGSHEHYGIAFYSPPPSDFIHELERKHAARVKELEDRLSQYQGYAEDAVKRAYGLRSDDHIYIDRYGAHRLG